MRWTRSPTSASTSVEPIWRGREERLLEACTVDSDPDVLDEAPGGDEGLMGRTRCLVYYIRHVVARVLETPAPRTLGRKPVEFPVAEFKFGELSQQYDI